MKRKTDTMQVLREVRAERKKQDAKWGQQDHDPTLWLTILLEEVGEASRGVLETNLKAWRREMIQVAAVAAAAVECLDRGDWEIRWVEGEKSA